jgi:hypothetical protein
MATNAPSTGAPSRAPIANYHSPGYRALSLDTIDAIARINQACREHGIPPSLFGRRALGDPRFYSDLMKGRSLRPQTTAKINAFIVSLGEARHGA